MFCNLIHNFDVLRSKIVINADFNPASSNIRQSISAWCQFFYVLTLAIKVISNVLIQQENHSSCE